MSAKAYNVTGSTGRGEVYANAPTLRSTLRNSAWRKSAMGSGAEPRNCGLWNSSLGAQAG